MELKFPTKRSPFECVAAVPFILPKAFFLQNSVSAKKIIPANNVLFDLLPKYFIHGNLDFFVCN